MVCYVIYWGWCFLDLSVLIGYSFIFEWDLSTKFHSFMYSVYGMTIKNPWSGLGVMSNFAFLFAVAINKPIGASLCVRVASQTTTIWQSFSSLGLTVCSARSVLAWNNNKNPNRYNRVSALRAWTPKNPYSWGQLCLQRSWKWLYMHLFPPALIIATLVLPVLVIQHSNVYKWFKILPLSF